MFFHLFELKNIRRPIFFIYNRFHFSLLFGCYPSTTHVVEVSDGGWRPPRSMGNGGYASTSGNYTTPSVMSPKWSGVA
jgi:hypothetical protein